VTVCEIMKKTIIEAIDEIETSPDKIKMFEEIKLVIAKYK
jgi:hypothetical protein